jgi:hypothetical protein
MTFTFGDLAVIVGIVGLGGLAIAIAAKYTGVGEFVNLLVNAWHAFVNMMGRILSFAPGPIKILFFILGGVMVMGVIVSWFVAGDLVCSSCRVYEGPSYVQTMLAKLSPAEEGKMCVNGQRVIDPTYVASGNAPEYTAYTSRLVSVDSFGTIVGDSSELPPGNPLTQGVSQKVMMTSTLAENGSAYKGSMSLCRVSSFLPNARPSKYGGLAAGDCYLAAPGGLCYGVDKRLGSLTYMYETQTVKMQDGSTSEVPLFNLEYQTVNNMEDGGYCKQARAGALNFTTGSYYYSGTTFSGTANKVDVPIQSGWVNLAQYEYVESVSGAGVSKSGDYYASKRALMVQAPGSAFEERLQGSSDVITYGCTGKDDLAVLVGGIDVFDIHTMVVLIVIFGVIWILFGLRR